MPGGGGGAFIFQGDSKIGLHEQKNAEIMLASSALKDYP